MPSVVDELKAILREIDALSANQAPTPEQISTFSQTIPLTGAFPEIHTATFPQGLRLYQAYISGDQFAYVETSVSGNVVSFEVFAVAGSTMTVVSLSEFILA